MGLPRSSADSTGDDDNGDLRCLRFERWGIENLRDREEGDGEEREELATNM